MRYGKFAGPVFCRYARTPPVINSALASEYGIQAEMGYKPQPGMTIEEGRNVKLRLILDDRRTRMTCHGVIDWVEVDDETGEYRVGFSRLSLSDEEFKVLLANFTEEPVHALAFGESVRREVEETVPVTRGENDREIVRDKALSMPVSLIEEIDKRRADTPFSDYVVAILSEHFSRG